MVSPGELLQRERELHARAHDARMATQHRERIGALPATPSTEALYASALAIEDLAREREQVARSRVIRLRMSRNHPVLPA